MATKVKIYLDSYRTAAMTSIGVVSTPLEFTGENLFVEVKDNILEVTDYVQGISRNVLFGCPIHAVRYWSFD